MPPQLRPVVESAFLTALCSVVVTAVARWPVVVGIVAVQLLPFVVAVIVVVVAALVAG